MLRSLIFGQNLTLKAKQPSFLKKNLFYEIERKDLLDNVAYQKVGIELSNVADYYVKLHEELKILFPTFNLLYL